MSAVNHPTPTRIDGQIDGRLYTTPVSAADLAGALCIGQHELFDSTEWSDHVRARAICERCPVFDACTRRLAQTQEAAMAGHTNGPIGTWAGTLVGVPGKPGRPRKRRVRT